MYAPQIESPKRQVTWVKKSDQVQISEGGIIMT
jgi:hypothetical protein